MKTAFSIIFILITISSHGQTFDKFKDNINQCNVVRYYKIDYQLAVEKRIPFDTTAEITFVIGAYIDKKQSSIVDVLFRSGGSIKLENGTKINLLGEIKILNQGGSMEVLAVKHELTSLEFELLTNNAIEYFSIMGTKKEFDKYQREHIKKAITNLKIEPGAY